MGTKIIFLDLDGVINLCKCDEKRFEEIGMKKEDAYKYASPFATQRISEICRQTGSHVVFEGTMGKEVYLHPEDHSDESYNLPDGRNIMEALRNAGVIVDGYAFDRHTMCDKLEGITKYIKDNDIENYIIIEDGNLFSREESIESTRQRLTPDLLPIYEQVITHPERQIDTNVPDNKWVPYGLCDKDIETAIALFTSRELELSEIKRQKRKESPLKALDKTEKDDGHPLESGTHTDKTIEER